MVPLASIVMKINFKGQLNPTKKIVHLYLMIMKKLLIMELFNFRGRKEII